MTEEPQPFAVLTDETLQALLKRALRNTLFLGGIAAVVVLIAEGWRDAAMLLIGAAISAASVWEWMRLVRLMNARMRNQMSQQGTVLVVGFFLLRLLFFAAAIYVSLKCFRGSVIVLVCGLSLAVATLMWEGLRLLRS